MENGNTVAFFIDFVETEYSEGLIEGARSFFKKHGVDLMVFETGNINSPSQTYGYQRLSIASLINSRSFSGMIFVSGSQLYHTTPEYLASYLKSFAPMKIVSIGYDFPEYPSVLSSCKTSMKELTEHLITQHGCRRIALLTVKANLNDVQQRTEVYRQVMREHNLEEELIYCEGWEYTQIMDALSFIKSDTVKFDAIMCMNDEMACACLDVLASAGIAVPQKVIVTGFDDELHDSFMTPSLTSINQNTHRQGYTAAKMLFDLMSGKEPEHKKRIESSVMYRESCRCIGPGLKKGLFLDSKGGLHEAKRRDLGFLAVSKWLTNRTHFVKITQMYANMQTDITLDSLSHKICEGFSASGISCAAVCFFKNPVATDIFEYFALPQEAYVFSAYDNATGKCVYYSEKCAMFNPNQTIIPDGIIENFDGIHVVALYKNTILYGYALYRQGSYDPTVYAVSFRLLSSIIESAFTTSRVLKEYELVKAVSMTDEMTGLLNRRGFMTRGKTMLAETLKRGKNGIILFGDIDGLKKINDTYGHSTGDVAIRAEAGILKEVFGTDCTVGRMGGDEFAVIAPYLTVEKFAAVKRKIEDKCAAYNRNSGQKFTLSMSIGCVPFSKKTSTSLHTLLSLADKELYKEKEIRHANRV